MPAYLKNILYAPQENAAFGRNDVLDYIVSLAEKFDKKKDYHWYDSEDLDKYIYYTFYHETSADGYIVISLNCGYANVNFLLQIEGSHVFIIDEGGIRSFEYEYCEYRFKLSNEDRAMVGVELVIKKDVLENVIAWFRRGPINGGDPLVKSAANYLANKYKRRRNYHYHEDGYDRDSSIEGGIFGCWKSIYAYSSHDTQNELYIYYHLAAKVENDNNNRRIYCSAAESAKVYHHLPQCDEDGDIYLYAASEVCFTYRGKEIKLQSWIKVRDNVSDIEELIEDTIKFNEETAWMR